LLASNQGRLVESAAIVDPLLSSGVEEIGARPFVTASISATCTRSLDGRCLDAIALAEQAFAVCTELGPQLVSDGKLDGQAWFSMTLGRVLLSIGKLEEAERCFVEGSAAFAGIHSHGPRHWSLAGAIMAAASRGDAAAAHRWHDERLALPEHPAALMRPEIARSEAHLAFVDGERSVAISRLRAAVEKFRADGAMALLGWLLHDIVRFGGTVEPDEAALLLGGEGDLVPARRALLTAEREQDAVALEASVDRFDALGSPLFAAEAALLAAGHFAGAGDVRDEARCRRRADERRRAFDVPSVATMDLLDRSGPDPLTRREREVAELAAAGRSNRAIADELFVSIRTVENHLQRVYDKLGVSGRRELADTLVS